MRQRTWQPNAGSKVWRFRSSQGQPATTPDDRGQKASFEIVPIDGPIGGFADAHATASALVEAIVAIAGLDRTKLLLFGGWESATRGAGITLQLVGEQLGIMDQFQVLTASIRATMAHLKCWSAWKLASIRIRFAQELQRCWAGPRQPCRAPQQPAVGMANMRTIMPAMQRRGP